MREAQGPTHQGVCVWGRASPSETMRYPEIHMYLMANLTPRLSYDTEDLLSPEKPPRDQVSLRLLRHKDLEWYRKESVEKGG